jgi:hypothetical protein
MKISDKTISALEKIISGNQISAEKHLAPYRSGPELISFFKQFGSTDEYDSDFPSRWKYVENKLWEYNGSSIMEKVIEAALDPRTFLGSEFDVQGTLDYINSYLKYDGYEIRVIGNYHRVRKVGGNLVNIRQPFSRDGNPNHEFILEQLAKSEQKVADGDYDGAITNTRSLLEAVLLEMEYLLIGERKKYDGNLSKLNRKVYKLLNLDPARSDITNSLREILGGLISIVSGMASLRNKMSDAHARSYKPDKHHAELAINSARTIVSFLFDTFAYQLNSGSISIVVIKSDNTS